MFEHTSNGSRAMTARVPRQWISNGVHNRPRMYADLVENGILREDQTRSIDDALVRVAARDLVGIADLTNNGLVDNLMDIGITSYEYDRVTPVGQATQSMSILNLGDRDLVDFERAVIPIPVTASQFRLDARARAAGGHGSGPSVSLINLEAHTRSVSEKLEDTLFNGSDVVLNGSPLPGYTNFGGREQLSFSGAPWNASGADPITDMIAARAALRANGFSGPYMVYMSPNFDGTLDQDFKEFGDRTLRERLLALDGVAGIKIAPALGDDQVLVVQMTSNVVQLAVGQDITTVSWDIYGGLASHWAVLAVMAPVIRAAWSRQPLSEGVLPPLTLASGIAHIS